ncbi:MAG: peptidylprolyl isomerase [Spirochaetaceae bacterium]|jgi:hypothetical protein|nr:peptidylprolyl isomerase [Spirochaetaceae bacterium]
MKDEKKKSAEEQSEFKRRFKQNPVLIIGAFVIAILSVLSFVLFPAIVPQAAGAFSNELVFGSYDGTTIQYVPGNNFANTVRYYASMYGKDINTMSGSDYNTMQIWNSAYKDAATRVAMLKEMQAADYVAPDSLVDKEVAGNSQFHENGRFSPALYRSLDNATRLALWRDTRDSLAVGKYLEDLTSIKSSDAEKKFLGEMARKVRSFQMAAFPLSSYPDSEALKFAAVNPALFMQVHLSQITVADKAAADSLLNEIKAGTQTFEDAAKASSSDRYAQQGGDMGTMTAYGFDTIITDETERKAVLALKDGEYSAVVTVPGGFAFYRCEEDARPLDTSKPEQIAIARAYMQGFERGQMEDYIITAAQKIASDTPSLGFEEASKAVANTLFWPADAPFSVQSFGPVPLNFGGDSLLKTLDTSSISSLVSASNNENFWENAFATPVNSASKPFVMGDYIVSLYPTEETTDEEGVSSVDTQLSYWFSYSVQQSISNFFFNSPKMKDNFWDAFSRLYGG